MPQETYDKSLKAILMTHWLADWRLAFSSLMIWLTLLLFMQGSLRGYHLQNDGYLSILLGFIWSFGQSTSLQNRLLFLTLPVLNKKRMSLSLRDFGVWWSSETWCEVTLILIVLLLWLGPNLDLIRQRSNVKIAMHVLGFLTLSVLFVSAILAGWLMGLLSWLLCFRKEDTNQSGS